MRLVGSTGVVLVSVLCFVIELCDFGYEFEPAKVLSPDLILTIVRWANYSANMIRLQATEWRSLGSRALLSGGKTSGESKVLRPLAALADPSGEKTSVVQNPSTSLATRAPLERLGAESQALAGRSSDRRSIKTRSDFVPLIFARFKGFRERGSADLRERRRENKAREPESIRETVIKVKARDKASVPRTSFYVFNVSLALKFTKML
ncbi:hypothetical protein Nepgr_002798 [Nepenthes gracilis]|uniref:Uncharacterized protein n=1 Tax=Nepenthes gracilis TaxID=150966 RepID=A0AAD3P6Z8_NEPGR|nr:hypothetical protein Nepgr_002798 [Nepenthes gracilis]